MLIPLAQNKKYQLFLVFHFNFKKSQYLSNVGFSYIFILDLLPCTHVHHISNSDNLTLIHINNVINLFSDQNRNAFEIDSRSINDIQILIIGQKLMRLMSLIQTTLSRAVFGPGANPRSLSLRVTPTLPELPLIIPLFGEHADKGGFPVAGLAHHNESLQCL